MTKSKYRGAYFLAFLIVLVSGSNLWYNQLRLEKENPEDFSTRDNQKLDSLLAIIEQAKEWNKESLKSKPEDSPKSFDSKKTEPKLHYFDPNKIGREEWLAMNLPERVFNGLEKYREKGGKFRVPEQVLKLYNLDEELGKQMLPFIRIDSSLFAKPKFEFKKTPFPEKPKYVPFNINEADTTQLMTVFGIGRGIANRIVRQRNGLGGFYSKAYLYDVFALDSSVVEELFKKGFLPENPEIQKLNINTSDEETIAKNPYLRKGLARIIVKYRNQHGPFKKPEDLLEIKIMKPEVIEKLRPYLSF